MALAQVVLTAATMGSAAGDSSHKDLAAAFGASVREFWKSSRAKVKTSLVSPNSKWETRLRMADLYSRGFSAYDSEANLRQPPTKALHAFWQASYCLVQTGSPASESMGPPERKSALEGKRLVRPVRTDLVETG